LSIKILLADDSDVMRRAIVKLLNEEPSTELVGEAKGFAETIQLANTLKPDVLLMDLHMSDEREYSPESVRVQLSTHAGCIVRKPRRWPKGSAHASCSIKRTCTRN